MNTSDKLPIAKGDRMFTVVASRSHMSEETTAFIDQLKLIHGDINLISKGSSLKLCLVAEGAAEVYPRFAPTMEWDTAAGHAIALGAGLTVRHTDSNEPLIYNKENLLNPWFVVA
jgi:3'(2'), 5'-bisphosphate nucleotidase